ncbi:hypothetical protein FB451DRAFT_1435424 [Mycena latifolia]|nr:hypothetical protein FB451DRAFT_1435424 [Mycena latifolia]
MIADADGWVLVFVASPWRLSPPSMSIHKPPPKRASTPQLPPELWMDIHRLATAHLSPLVAAFDVDDCSDDDPLNERDLQRYLRAVRALGRVCRQWTDLTHGLLYENVHVNRRFASLAAALARPETAGAVRSVRLSTTRFDHNAAVLAQCPQIRLLVQPEFPRSERLYAAPDAALPPLHALTRIHWIDSSWSAALLARVLHAAPNLSHIALASSPTIGSDPDFAAPPALPSLRVLSLSLAPRAPPPAAHMALLRAARPALRTLTLAPAHLAPPAPALPPLPALHTLALRSPHDAAARASFPLLAAHFPGLRELRCDARCAFDPPASDADAGLPALACVRLRLPAGHAYSAAAAHLRLLLAPAFLGVGRVVLEGRWAAAGPEVAVLCAQLRARGCVVEGAGAGP